MVRYIHSNESADAAGNGQSFQLGGTVFVVAGPSIPRAQSRPQGLSLTSLTIPMPLDDAGQDDATPAEDPVETSVADRDADFDPNADDGDGDDFDSAQLRGTELLAPPTAGPTPGPLERRLASIIPGDPDPADVGLTQASPLQIYPSGDDERPSRGRRLVVALVLLLLVASLALTVHYQRQTQRELQALRSSFANAQRTTDNAVVEEVRREIRALPLPNPKDVADQAERQAQAILELKQTIAERAQKSEGQTQQLSEVIRAELAGHKQPAPDLNVVKEPILSELRQVKDALAELRARPAYVPPPVPAPAATAAAAVTAARTPSPAPAPVASAPKSTSPNSALAPNNAADSPDASATLAQAQLSVASHPAERPGTVYLVDATGSLRDLVPETLAEVRRLIQHEDAAEAPYVLMLYAERLVRVAGLPQPRGSAADAAAPPVVDLGSADLSAAVKIALEARPRALHILSDRLAGGEKVADLLKQLNREGTRIDATQLHYRDGQESMKRIARENNGMYSYIPASR